LLFTYFEADSQSFETKVVPVIKETVPAYSNDSYNELKSQMGSVTTQIKDLITNNNQLQKQIETISISINNMQKKHPMWQLLLKPPLCHHLFHQIHHQALPSTTAHNQPL